MGWTRSIRYANHRSGRKYVGPVPSDSEGRSGAHVRPIAPREPDPEKLESAKIFRERLDAVLGDSTYDALHEDHERRQAAPSRAVKKINVVSKR